MKWEEAENQTDAAGYLTPLALACRALVDTECDFDVGEEYSCLAFRCKAALRSMLDDNTKLQAELDTAKMCEEYAHRGELVAVDQADDARDMAESARAGESAALERVAELEGALLRLHEILDVELQRVSEILYEETPK